MASSCYCSSEWIAHKFKWVAASSAPVVWLLSCSSWSAIFRYFKATRGFAILKDRCLFVRLKNLLFVVACEVIEGETEKFIMGVGLVEVTDWKHDCLTLFEVFETLERLAVLEEAHRSLVQFKTLLFQLELTIKSCCVAKESKLTNCVIC